MQFEEVYDHIGHFGWYQFLVYLLCGFVAISHGYQVSAMVFLGMEQDHFCKVNELANFSYEQQLDIAIPKDGDSFSQCEVYNLTWHEYSTGDFVNWDRTIMTANASKVQCNQWIHVRSVLSSTVVTQFDLVCGQNWYVQFGSTIYTAGMMLASFVSGILSDRFGRLKTTITGLFLHPAMAIAAAYSPNIQVFCVFRFLTGVFAFTAYLGGYVMIAEWVGKTYRTYASITYASIFAVGMILYTLEAYFVRDHILLQLCMAIPLFATVFYFWVFPESARWLHAKGRSDEAIKLLRLAAEVNGRELPADFHLDREEQKKEGPKRGILDLFRYAVFRKIIIFNFFIWFSNSLIFYGIGLNVGSLVGDIFLNTFLTYFADIPANTIAAFCTQRFGRRKTLCAAFLIGSLSNLAQIPLVLTGELDWLLVTLTVIGRAGASAAFCTTYLLTAESFPTEIRHVALGSCSTFSRLAGMLAPYVGSPMANIWQPLPSLIFGTFGLGSAVCVMMLKETLNRPLPDRVEDVINIQGKDKAVPGLHHVPTSQIDLTSAMEKYPDFESFDTQTRF